MFFLFLLAVAIVAAGVMKSLRGARAHPRQSLLTKPVPKGKRARLDHYQVIVSELNAGFRAKGIEATASVTHEDGTPIDMRLTVAITGKLSQSRDTYAWKLEKVANVRYVASVSQSTDFLVAARFDTEKARKAAAYGVIVITEEDLNQFIDAGAFPEKVHRNYAINNFPEIVWRKTVHEPQIQLLKYTNAEGVTSERFIEITRYGVGQDGSAYFEGFDGTKMKTFREDRVISLAPVLSA